MKLSMEEFADIKYYVEHDSGLNKQDLKNMVETIESLHQKIEKDERSKTALANMIESLYQEIAQKDKAIRLAREALERIFPKEWAPTYYDPDSGGELCLWRNGGGGILYGIHDNDCKGALALAAIDKALGGNRENG